MSLKKNTTDLQNLLTRIQALPEEHTITLQDKTVTENDTYTADSGYDGLGEVTVNVPTGTARGASDVAVSGATVTVPAGLYSDAVSKSVASGTAGTPTATKAVNGNTATVTPSVTNTTGYVEGGTKTGEAVTVSASELVSGSQSFTANGTYDVTNKASAVVNVPTGTARSGNDVTVNGATVSVPAGLYGSAVSKSVANGAIATPTVNNSGLVTASVGTAGYMGAGTSKTLQLPTQGAQTITPSLSPQTIAGGKYLTGNQTISAITAALLAQLDSDFTAENIAKDVDLFGLIGTHEGGGGGSGGDIEIIQGSVTPDTESGGTMTIYREDGNTHSSAILVVWDDDRTDPLYNNVQGRWVMIQIMNSLPKNNESGVATYETWNFGYNSGTRKYYTPIYDTGGKYIPGSIAYHDFSTNNSKYKAGKTYKFIILKGVNLS